MTDIPAGWYNDPEDVTQLRYWNGNEWTEHRSPRALAGAAAPDGGAWGIVGATFRLIVEGWAQLLVLALPLIVSSIGAAILAYVSLDSMLDPGIETILDRVTQPGFDPVDNGADEAFIDSIDVSIGTIGILGLIGAGLAVVLGTFISSTSFSIFLARVRAGRGTSIGETYQRLARRLPRMIGIALLWSLLGLIAATIVVGLFVVAILVSPALLLALVPALLVAVIYFWPVGALAYTALALSPREAPPLRHAFRIVRPLWGPIAGRLLILTLVGFVVSFAFNLGTSWISSVGVVAAFVVPLLLQALQSMLNSAGSVVLYEFAGGSVDPAITAEHVGSPAPFS
ncbi:MAG: DUF2510 domain-containing protein [Acidimicrobiales bacterium]